jgi:hypothetical protein
MKKSGLPKVTCNQKIIEELTLSIEISDLKIVIGMSSWFINFIQIWTKMDIHIRNRLGPWSMLHRSLDCWSTALPIEVPWFSMKLCTENTIVHDAKLHRESVKHNNRAIRRALVGSVIQRSVIQLIPVKAASVFLISMFQPWTNISIKLKKLICWKWMSICGTFIQT